MTLGMFTCYADMCDRYAVTRFYATFCALTDYALTVYGYPTAIKLFGAICEDVARDAHRTRDVIGWRLFAQFANRYAHERGELASDRVLVFRG